MKADCELWMLPIVLALFVSETLETKFTLVFLGVDKTLLHH